MQGLTTRVRDALQYIKSLEIKTFKLHLPKQVNNKLFPFLRENHKVTIKRKPADWDIIGNKINVRFLDGGSNSDDGSLRQWCGWRRQAIGGQSGSMCKCLLLHKEQRFL